MKIHSLEDIYNLAGPLINKEKDKCIKFHINRSKNYKNLGSNLRKNNTKKKLLRLIQNNVDMTTTKLQFYVNVGTDVILDHLHKLEKGCMIFKKRNGKRYVWNGVNNAG